MIQQSSCIRIPFSTFQKSNLSTMMRVFSSTGNNKEMTTNRRMTRMLGLLQLLLIFASSAAAFVSRQPYGERIDVSLGAKPKRLADNVEGPLFVNEKCINCAACSMFAPSIFSRTDGAHIVHRQPETPQEIEQARASLSACPVAAIRVQTKADRNHRGLPPPTEEDQALAPKFSLNQKFNGLELPFPRLISPNVPNAWHVGHHHDQSFGAVPYLVSSGDQWIMVDTPRYCKSAIEAVETVTGPNGPDYLLLTHVDDTADHGKWKEKYPNLREIFHVGDTGRHNWIGDKSLGEVEILLQEATKDDAKAPLQFFTINGTPVSSVEETDEDVLIVHTPGHSPGSISLWKRPSEKSPGILFTGDTYSYTTRNDGYMTGFPRYGNNLHQQSRTISRLLELDWQLIAPGHGHVRDYTILESDRQEELQSALQELTSY